MVNSTHLTTSQPSESLGKLTQPSRSIEQAQDSIYRFLLDIVKQWSAEAVLQEFSSLFIQQSNSVNSDPVQAVKELVSWDDEEKFQSTIKRCCYILINNWKANKKERYIYSLVEILSTKNSRQQPSSPTGDRLKSWVRNFVDSNDYQELKLLASKCQGQVHWSDRYTSNLSVTEPNNSKKLVERREAAQDQAKPLQYRSKFDVAMYMARSQSGNVNRLSKNPTRLTDEVLRLIKIIVAKREPLSYANIANTFIRQNKQINYQQFKQRLQKYLIYSMDNLEVVDTSKINILDKLALLNDKCHEQSLTDALLLRTCNRLIDYLTTENHRTPSSLFSSLISQGNHMTLVIVLLKIVLICKASRTHLQTCVTELSLYYENAPETEYKSATNFIEIYKVMFAIYVDNVSVKLD